MTSSPILELDVILLSYSSRVLDKDEGIDVLIPLALSEFLAIIDYVSVSDLLRVCKY